MPLVVVYQRHCFPTGCSDRKSTRLNSSHLGISYAVFCLKKKKKRIQQAARDAKTAYPGDRMRNPCGSDKEENEKTLPDATGATEYAVCQLNHATTIALDS